MGDSLCGVLSAVTRLGWLSYLELLSSQEGHRH